jgi:hypothetical protein
VALGRAQLAPWCEPPERAGKTRWPRDAISADRA